jgi:3-oxoacyl-[acyl-carrier protein] reductase
LPVRRLGTVKEIAETVLYLASDGAGYLNGAVIDVNGGHFMP